MPAARAIYCTVRGLSPLITRIDTPCPCKKRTVSCTPSRKLLRNITIPSGLPEPRARFLSGVFASENPASSSTRIPRDTHESICLDCTSLNGASFATNSGAPITSVCVLPLITARTPANLRADEKARTPVIFASAGGLAAARIAAAVILPPPVSRATSAARRAISVCASNDSHDSSVTSSLVSVPVLSTQSTPRSAIASIADSFCGNTFACAKCSDPNASSKELASNNPSGITVTDATVIVFKICIESNPEK